MPSNPGQNLHLVSSQIHAVASSSHLANSSSQLVVLSSYLVESSSHLVVSSILLTSPLLVYSSVILQLVVSPFNSSCRTSTRRSLYPYIFVVGKPFPSQPVLELESCDFSFMRSRLVIWGPWTGSEECAKDVQWHDASCASPTFTTEMSWRRLLRE